MIRRNPNDDQRAADDGMPLTGAGFPGAGGSVSSSPRTDVAASDGWSGDAECVSADFARKIESELTQAHAEIVRLRTALNRIAYPATYRTVGDPMQLARVAVAIRGRAPNK